MTPCLPMLYTLAARRTRTPDEADDLVQDVLLIALEQGRALDDPRFPAWAAGVLRRRALFVARTAGRRARREAAFAGDPPPPPRAAGRRAGVARSSTVSR